VGHLLAENHEHVEETDRGLGGIAGVGCEFHTAPIGRELAVVSVAGEKRIHLQLIGGFRRQVLLCKFFDEPVSTLIQVNMLHLVPEHGRELVFRIHHRQNSSAYKDLATGKSERTLEGRIGIEVEAVGKLALGMGREPVSNSL
jgi:hypothetical protein